MYTKTKYCCGLCNREYDLEQQANTCESLGIPPETSHIKERQELSFIRNITNEVGAVSNFVEQSGKVLHVDIERNDAKNLHHHVFIVETEDEKGKYEGIVALLDIENKPQYFMAAAPRYKLGFADSVKQQKQ